MAPRNILRQPSFTDLDLRFVKDFTLKGEGHHLDLFMDIFNIAGSQNRNFGPNAVSLFGDSLASALLRRNASLRSRRHTPRRSTRDSIHRPPRRLLKAAATHMPPISSTMVSRQFSLPLSRHTALTRSRNAGCSSFVVSSRLRSRFDRSASRSSNLAAPAQEISAGQPPAALLGGLEWRDVGPMRGGRTYAVAGDASQPDTFYMGSVGGGVWKTENAGRTWFPISDEGIPIGSIGAIAVAPSDPNIIYVGTGEPDIRSQHSYGIGIFKSTDAGKTWTSIGLEDTRQIGRIVVDPHNPNLVYVAALGHVYDANPDSRRLSLHRWRRALEEDSLRRAATPTTSAPSISPSTPVHPRTLYASLWSTRRPPWSVYAPSNLPGGGLYKSTDGGDTWQKLSRRPAHR